MKLKYIFTSLVAALGLMAVSCTPETQYQLSEIQVSSSYIAIPAEGGNVEITLTAQDAWEFASVVETGKDADNKPIMAQAPTWLTITPLSGSAGEATVKFHADAAEATREASLQISCAGKTQRISVIQMTEAVEPTILSVSEVIAMAPGLAAGTIPEQTIYVRGIVSKIDEISTAYGNATFYLSDDGTHKGSYNSDGTGDANWFEVYRGYWLNGAKFTKGDEFSVGDELVVTGLLMSYKGTPETNQNTASVVSIKKSLITMSAPDFTTIPAEGLEFELAISAKATPLMVTTDASWLKVTDVKNDPKKGDIYVFTAEANDTPKTRKATITVKAPGALKSVDVTQEGIPATGSSITDIVAMDDNSQIETLESTVVALTTKGAVISDGTTAVYVYGTSAAALKEGDNVKVFGKKTTYNGVPEITDLTEVTTISSGNTVKHPSSKNITEDAGNYKASVAEYISLTGTLVKSGNYYNISLDAFTDGSKQGSIVYPVEALNAASFDGKKITVTGYFNGLSSAGKYINIIATKIEEAGVVTGSTIAEIIASADASTVETQEVLVVAISTKSAVIADATGAVYVYATAAAALKVGDKVKMTATKTTYGGVPELTNPTISVISSGNAVTYPTAKDITAVAGTYAANVTEYISLTGTLAKSGNYYNLNLDAFTDGSKQGSINNPVAALNVDSFDGKKITVTGYFVGLTSKDKYINIVATSIEEVASGPSFAIDGNFDEWADVEAQSSVGNRFKSWKYASDATNIYFYYQIDASKIKSDGSSKIYIGFDMDKNPATGAQGEFGAAGTSSAFSITESGLEAVAYFYPWDGTTAVVEGGVLSDSYVKCPADGEETGKVTMKGKIDGGDAYIELSITRQSIGSPAAGASVIVNHAMQYYPTGRTVITL